MDNVSVYHHQWNIESPTGITPDNPLVYMRFVRVVSSDGLDHTSILDLYVHVATWYIGNSYQIVPDTFGGYMELPSWIEVREGVGYACNDGSACRYCGSENPAVPA